MRNTHLLSLLLAVTAFSATPAVANSFGAPANRQVIRLVDYSGTRVSPVLPTNSQAMILRVYFQPGTVQLCDIAEARMSFYGLKSGSDKARSSSFVANGVPFYLSAPYKQTGIYLNKLSFPGGERAFFARNPHATVVIEYLSVAQ